MSDFTFTYATNPATGITTALAENTSQGGYRAFFDLDPNGQPRTNPVSRLSCQACTGRSIVTHVYCVTPTGGYCLDQRLVGAGTGASTILSTNTVDQTQVVLKYHARQWCSPDDLHLESSLDCAFQTPGGEAVLAVLLLVAVLPLIVYKVRHYYHRDRSTEVTVAMPQRTRPAVPPPPVVLWSGARPTVPSTHTAAPDVESND